MIFLLEDDLQHLHKELDDVKRLLAMAEGGLGPNLPALTARGREYRRKLRSLIREIEDDIEALESELDA